MRLGEQALVPEEVVWAPREGQGDAVRVIVVLPKGVRGRQYVYVDVRASADADDDAYEGRGVIPVLVQ